MATWADTQGTPLLPAGTRACPFPPRELRRGHRKVSWPLGQFGRPAGAELLGSSFPNGKGVAQGTRGSIVVPRTVAESARRASEAMPQIGARIGQNSADGGAHLRTIRRQGRASSALPRIAARIGAIGADLLWGRSAEASAPGRTSGPPPWLRRVATPDFPGGGRCPAGGGAVSCLTRVLGHGSARKLLAREGLALLLGPCLTVA
jgi:hypothetical protein